jgi:hypoxanthine phosphoribosyltransferase
VDVQPLFTAAEIANRTRELGLAFRRDAGNAEVFLLGLLKGTTCFVADLLRAIPGNVSYGFIDVVQDIADTETATAMEIDFLRFAEIRGKHVFLIKDVVSTGIIETYLLQQLRLHDPAELRLVALLDRPALRRADLKVDFRAFEVGDGAFVGYGLELDGRHANLPFIARTNV